MLLHNKKIIYGVVGYCAIRSKSVLIFDLFDLKQQM